MLGLLCILSSSWSQLYQGNLNIVFRSGLLTVFWHFWLFVGLDQFEVTWKLPQASCQVLWGVLSHGCLSSRWRFLCLVPCGPKRWFLFFCCLFSVCWLVPSSNSFWLLHQSFGTCTTLSLGLWCCVESWSTCSHIHSDLVACFGIWPCSGTYDCNSWRGNFGSFLFLSSPTSNWFSLAMSRWCRYPDSQLYPVFPRASRLYWSPINHECSYDWTGTVVSFLYLLRLWILISILPQARYRDVASPIPATWALVKYTSSQSIMNEIIIEQVILFLF